MSKVAQGDELGNATVTEAWSFAGNTSDNCLLPSKWCCLRWQMSLLRTHFCLTLLRQSLILQDQPPFQALLGCMLGMQG